MQIGNLSDLFDNISPWKIMLCQISNLSLTADKERWYEINVSSHLFIMKRKSEYFENK